MIGGGGEGESLYKPVSTAVASGWEIAPFIDEQHAVGVVSPVSKGAKKQG